MKNKSDLAQVSQEVPQPVAGNGLLDRRVFMKRSGWLLGAAASAGAATTASAASIGESAPKWMTTPGMGLREYGTPSAHAAVKRAVLKPYGDMAPGTGISLTPLQSIHGAITPNGLHFERSHNGVPDIDPEQHELVIHGLVKQPLKFSYNDLLRYPNVTRICFIECAGNSFFNSNLMPEPQQVPVGHLHGLMSTAEWTGIPLSVLLDEAGIKPEGKWLLAEGADAAGMSRSIPMEKAIDDVMIALYQNGEPVRPEQGYPMRLVVPGFEGNMNVKWLRRLKVTATPTYTKDETSKYTDLLPSGKSRLFTYTMGVKSTITQPSTGFNLTQQGMYEVSGLAWSGHGRITRVEVSADAGKTWADAALSDPNLPMSTVRFRVPWRWNGSPSTLMSRAHDDKGNVQVMRAEWSKQYAAGQLYHYNGIQAWKIASSGEVSNVYA